MGATNELFIQMQDELVNLSERATNGEIELLNASIQMRLYRNELQKGLDIIKEFENEQLEYIGQQSKEYKDGIYNGFKFEVRNGGTMYNFKSIDKVQGKEQELKDLKNLYKTAYKLKQDGKSMIDEDTGEIIDEFPEISYRKSSLIIKKV